jgi:hypothetical protein
MSTKKLLAACATALCLTAVGHAGVVIQRVTKDKGANTVQGEGTLYVQGGMLRSEQHDAQGRLVYLVLFRDNAIWQVNVGDHTYVKMDRAAMQQAMARVPPQLRAMMERMRGSSDAGSDESAWHDTGKTEHVGGYNCRLWEGTPIVQKEQMCVVPFAALPGGSELSATMQQVGRTVKEVLSGSFLGAAAGSFDQYAKLNGIPAVQRTEYGDTYMKSVEQRSLPVSTFQVPEGYQEKKMNLGVPGAGARARDN